GNYAYIASYSGDPNYNPSWGDCEPFTIDKASPTLTTTILKPTTSGVTAGSVTVQDRATLDGGVMYKGTGTLSFVLKDSSNNSIAGTSYSTTVSADGNYDTPSVTVTLSAGVYHWVVSFTGDANNNKPPDVTDETFVVTGTSGNVFTLGYWQNNNGRADL